MIPSIVRNRVASASAASAVLSGNAAMSITANVDSTTFSMSQEAASDSAHHQPSNRLSG